MEKKREIYFRSILCQKLQRIQLSIRKKLLEMTTSDPQRLPDLLDHSAMEVNLGIESLIHDRHVLLMRDIEEALAKIDQGVYGICEECGCFINEKRLLICPTSSLCVKCQEREEQKVKLYRPTSACTG